MSDMEIKKNDALRMQDYYTSLSAVSFPTVFVPLTAEELQALAKGCKEGDVVKNVVERIAGAVKNLPASRFISLDTFSPVDTERYREKKGAVCSPESIWSILCDSARTREEAANGTIKNIVIRPFRRMDVAREFRLFIKGKKIAGMSQYHLVRHFQRLVEREEEYTNLAASFVEKIAPFLPEEDVVVDIYITHTRRIILVDLNKWGKTTDAKMLKWEELEKFNPGTDRPKYGIVPAPRKISGKLQVKF